jgi:hypothetical protein
MSNFPERERHPFPGRVSFLRLFAEYHAFLVVTRIVTKMWYFLQS